MKDPEKTLRTPALAEPGAEHRRRMDDLFRARERRSWLGRPIPVWQCGVACLLVGLSGLLAWSLLRRPVEIKNSYVENVYYVVTSEASNPPTGGVPAGFLTDPKRVQVRVYSVTQGKPQPEKNKI